MYPYIWVMSYLGDKSFGRRGIIPAPWDQVIVVIMAIAAYAWGVATALPRPLYVEHDEAEEAAEALAHF